MRAMASAHNTFGILNEAGISEDLHGWEVVTRSQKMITIRVLRFRPGKHHINYLLSTSFFKKKHLPINIIDISSISLQWPYSLNGPTQNTCPCSPVFISKSSSPSRKLFTSSRIPKQKFIGSRSLNANSKSFRTSRGELYRRNAFSWAEGPSLSLNCRN